MAQLPHLWPDDYNATDAAIESPEPDTELAVMLLAAGTDPAVIREKCGFPTMKACRAFLRDPETAAAARVLGNERQERVGNRAMVELERVLVADHDDLRARVLAIRTALEVSGQMRREVAPPVRRVDELSVAELGELIESTRAEISRRVAGQANVLPGSAGESTG